MTNDNFYFKTMDKCLDGPTVNLKDSSLRKNVKSTRGELESLQNMIARKEKEWKDKENEYIAKISLLEKEVEMSGVKEECKLQLEQKNWENREVELKNLLSTRAKIISQLESSVEMYKYLSLSHEECVTSYENYEIYRERNRYHPYQFCAQRNAQLQALTDKLKEYMFQIENLTSCMKKGESARLNLEEKQKEASRKHEKEMMKCKKEYAELSVKMIALSNRNRDLELSKNNTEAEVERLVKLVKGSSTRVGENSLDEGGLCAGQMKKKIGILERQIKCLYLDLWSYTSDKETIDKHVKVWTTLLNMCSKFNRKELEDHYVHSVSTCNSLNKENDDLRAQYQDLQLLLKHQKAEHTQLCKRQHK